MSCLDGYTLHLATPPHHPTIGISYPVRSLSRSSSSNSVSLKRKRSEEAMSITLTVAQNPPTASQDAPLVLPIIFPSVNRKGGDDAHPRPPSPAQTEIIEDVDEGSDICMEKAKALGVKVRDFAYEPLPAGRDRRAPEIWCDPLEALIMHDQYIRVAPRRAENLRPSGKHLYRLLALGWVTQEEAERHWRDEDWKAVKEYGDRPLGAYPFRIPAGSKKPTASYRAALRLDKHIPASDDLPEDQVYVPPDEPDMDDGPPRVDRTWLINTTHTLNLLDANPAFPAPPSPSPAAPAVSAARTASNPDAAHVAKKRRAGSSTPIAGESATPACTPPGTPAPDQAASSSAARAATPPRSSTPRAPPPRLTRRRAGLARTQTFNVIA
ncbi:hypothetical protein C8Q77DRAFT_1074499 [Trametes polyzona]|nr:hypothetical protein C8Q77DRAFT_1074499 [Trametes polyzona]